MKRINTIYFSPTGTTKKVIKSMCSKLGSIDKEYDITLEKNRKNSIKFNEGDLVIFGVPVYSGRVPDLLLDYFEKIEGNNTKAVFLVVYGNRDYDDSLLELKNIFEKKGFKALASAAFIGEHSYTKEVAGKRPDEKDKKIAEKLGLSIKYKLEKNNIDEIKVSGNYPYREKKPSSPITPGTYDTCIGCGICANNCPASAIDFKNYYYINKDKCIKCCSCIKKCPVQAKHFKDERIESVKEYLVENFSTERKEPVIFI